MPGGVVFLSSEKKELLALTHTGRDLRSAIDVLGLNRPAAGQNNRLFGLTSRENGPFGSHSHAENARLWAQSCEDRKIGAPLLHQWRLDRGDCQESVARDYRVSFGYSVKLRTLGLPLLGYAPSGRTCHKLLRCI
jgi:hypothetical protein